MVENCGIGLSKGTEACPHELEAHPTRQTVKKRGPTSQRPNAWESDLVSAPQQLQTPKKTPQKACFKAPAISQNSAHSAPNKHVGFQAMLARCLVTNAPYESHSQDGKSWRRQQSEEKLEERTRQALSGSHEYLPYVMTDRWADRGWESTGLGEDTPMGGISEEMDMEVALWRARQIEFDTRLEEQQTLAEEHRFAMEDEVRHLHGADGMMGTREFVKHRLMRMEPLKK